MKGAVQLLVGNGEHFCGLIPVDKEGASGMSHLCLTEKMIQALVVRSFFSVPEESAKGRCQNFCLKCVCEMLIHRTHGFACESLVTLFPTPILVQCGVHCLPASSLPKLTSHLHCVGVNLCLDTGLSMS